LNLGQGLGVNAPCTALGCVELLDAYGVDLRGKHGEEGWETEGGGQSKYDGDIFFPIVVVVVVNCILL
jgi:hypothetical protein